MRESSGKFDTVATNCQTDVKSFHAGRGSEGHLSWYAAYCVNHLRAVRHTKSTGMPPVTRGTFATRGHEQH